MNKHDLNFVRSTEKLFNTMGSKILSDMTGINIDYKFKVKVVSKEIFTGYGETYTFIEVYSNPPIPQIMEYSPEYSSKHNKTINSFNINLVASEFKYLLKYIGVNNPNSYIVEFTNVYHDDTLINDRFYNLNSIGHVLDTQTGKIHAMFKNGNIDFENPYELESETVDMLSPEERRFVEMFI